MQSPRIDYGVVNDFGDFGIITSSSHCYRNSKSSHYIAPIQIQRSLSDDLRTLPLSPGDPGGAAARRRR